MSIDGGYLDRLEAAEQAPFAVTNWRRGRDHERQRIYAIVDELIAGWNDLSPELQVTKGAHPLLELRRKIEENT